MDSIWRSTEMQKRVHHPLDRFFEGGQISMARIPDEEIERLKSEVSLERLAEHAGWS